MSLEQPWLGALGTLAVPALGHLYHFVLAVNITSGWGLSERNLGRLRLVLLAVVGGSAAFLLCRHLREPWWTWPWPLRGYALLCTVSGGLVLPISSLLLGMRPRPAGVEGRTDLLDLDDQHGVDAFVGAGKGHWLLRLPGNESLKLRRSEWTLIDPGLPPALDGLTIVQLSDLHFAPVTGAPISSAWWTPAWSGGPTWCS